jgi:hypothetical protein
MHMKSSQMSSRDRLMILKWISVLQESSEGLGQGLNSMMPISMRISEQGLVPKSMALTLTTLTSGAINKPKQHMRRTFKMSLISSSALIRRVGSLGRMMRQEERTLKLRQRLTSCQR